MRRGERRSSLFQSPLIQQQQQKLPGCGDGNPHIFVSDASSLYSVQEMQDELNWGLRRPSTQSVGAVIVAVCVSTQPHPVSLSLLYL